jgi:hypothetical protein
VRFLSGRPIATLQPVATVSCAREATTIQQSGGGMDTWPESVWTSHIEGRIERQNGQPGGYRRRQFAHFHERTEIVGDVPDRTAADV